MSIGLFLPTNLDFGGDHEVPFREVNLLKEAILDRDATPVVIDLSDHPDGPPITATDNGTLTVDGTTVCPLDLASAVVYPQFLFRHLYYKEWDELTSDPVGALNQLREHRGLFESLLTILADTGVRLTCPPDAFATHHRKLWQIHTFGKHNIPVPDTVITSNPDEAKTFVADHGRAVAKPVSGGFVPEVVTIDDLTEERLQILRRTPVQFQTYASGNDTRVYVVGTCTVGAIQYTYAEDHFSFKASADNVSAIQFDAPKQMRQAAETVTDLCGLKFAAVDMRYEEETGEFTVLEVNPGGRFALADKVGVDIAGPLTNWLLDDT